MMENGNLFLGILVFLAVAFGLFIYASSTPDELATGNVVLVEEIPLGICTFDYSPVCGMDEETYSNLCVMKSEGIDLLHVGECGGHVDIIYFGGSIITMEGDVAEYVEAVSVKNGNVVFTGGLVEAAKRQRINTSMRDLGRHTLFPDHIYVGGQEASDVVAMTSEMRGWTSYEDVKESIHSTLGIGKPADFIIIDLDLVIRERMNISTANILEIVKEGEIVYSA